MVDNSIGTKYENEQKPRITQRSVIRGLCRFLTFYTIFSNSLKSRIS